MDTNLFLKNAAKKIKKRNDIAEKLIEDEYCNYAKGQGCYPLKLIIVGLRGFPDRTTLCHGGRIIFIEFKKKGKQLSGPQQAWKRILIGLGFEYHVCDVIGQAEKALREFLFS